MKSNLKKIRAINKSEVNQIGLLRKRLYSNAYRHIKLSKEKESWLEVIAICDSLISDRVESLVARLSNQSARKRALLPLGKALHKYKLLLNSKGFSKDLFNEVVNWSDKRNRHLHEMVKVRENESLSWEDRIARSEKDAKQGLRLARLVDNECRRILNMIQ